MTNLGMVEISKLCFFHLQLYSKSNVEVEHVCLFLLFVRTSCPANYSIYGETEGGENNTIVVVDRFLYMIEIIEIILYDNIRKRWRLKFKRNFYY